MNTPTTNLRVHEFSSPKIDGSAAGARVAGNRATREKITRWRVSRLFWIKEELPLAMRSRQEKWAAGSCDPEHLGLSCWSADVEVDVKSPLNEADFHGMSFAEQVDYLRAWKPETSNWDSPVREGLAGILQAEVKAQPLPFFENANQFAGLDPLYSTALVRGFSEGLGGKTVLNWASFWAFAGWVLAQPDPETEIRDEFSGKTQLGRRWQSCRLEIARFLDATLNGTLAPLSPAERASVWPLIDVLRRDSNPSPADEVREDERIMDPLTLSLNTVRGVAVHAVFSFIHWIRSHSPTEFHGGRNLDDVPEARGVLETLLDRQLEPSLTIRSVFGLNLTRLEYWAETWLRAHLEQVFPVPGQDEQQRIAWETFIRFSLADSKTLALLHQQYSAAIAAMSPPGLERRRQHGTLVCLGQNLVMNYCRGILDFEQPGDLLKAFFARSPEPVRTEVMAFVGRSLAQSNGPIPTEILARLLRLWNWLVQRETPAGGPGFHGKAA
jgi:hypothetical protein